MAIIGIMGSMNTGKTSVLKLFVDYIEKNKISKIQGGIECSIEKVDFKGESEVQVDPNASADTGGEGAEGYTKTITPNKVVFIETKAGASHTIFAPGGDRERAVVRMGIITISRIARQIVALYAMDQPLKDQFKLYDLIRYMPKDIYVCLNKCDLLESADKEKLIEKFKKEIQDYFEKRHIGVKTFFQTCAINKPGAKELNDNSARMILDIALERV